MLRLIRIFFRWVTADWWIILYTDANPAYVFHMTVIGNPAFPEARLYFRDRVNAIRECNRRNFS